MNEKILDYDGVIIRGSDRRILENGDYLNNRIIELYFRYLFRSFGTDDMLLISPRVSSLLVKNSSDSRSFKDSIDRLKLDQRKLIFFPVNDCEEITGEEEEGSHWSLLVYCRKMHSFVHHDSLGGANDVQARKLYENVKDFVGYGGSSNVRTIISEKQEVQVYSLLYRVFYAAAEECIQLWPVRHGLCSYNLRVVHISVHDKEPLLACCFGESCRVFLCGIEDAW